MDGVQWSTTDEDSSRRGNSKVKGCEGGQWRMKIQADGVKSEKDGWKYIKTLVDGTEYRTRWTEVSVRAGGGG